MECIDHARPFNINSCQFDAHTHTSNHRMAFCPKLLLCNTYIDAHSVFSVALPPRHKFTPQKKATVTINVITSIKFVIRSKILFFAAAAAVAVAALCARAARLPVGSISRERTKNWYQSVCHQTVDRRRRRLCSFRFFLPPFSACRTILIENDRAEREK